MDGHNRGFFFFFFFSEIRALLFDFRERVGETTQPNEGKYRPEKLRIRTPFTQC